jgi:hypothetical protein
VLKRKENLTSEQRFRLRDLLQYNRNCSGRCARCRTCRQRQAVQG